jgi:DNA-binding transcriptional regulator YiaG
MTDETKRLEEIRKAKQLSIVAFTDLLPIARSTYYNWLQGRKPDPFRMKVCLKIASKL